MNKYDEVTKKLKEQEHNPGCLPAGYTDKKESEV